MIQQPHRKPVLPRTPPQKRPAVRTTPPVATSGLQRLYDPRVDLAEAARIINAAFFLLLLIVLLLFLAYATR